MKYTIIGLIALAISTGSLSAHPGRWVEGHWYQGHYYEGFYKEHKHHKPKPKPVKPVELTPEQAFLALLFGLTILNNNNSQ